VHCKNGVISSDLEGTLLYHAACYTAASLLHSSWKTRFNLQYIKNCKPPPSWIFEIAKFYWLTAVCRPQTHHCTKFRQNRSFHCGGIAIFDFSKWPMPPSWIFEIAKFYWLLGWRGSRRISILKLPIILTQCKALLSCQLLCAVAMLVHLPSTPVLPSVPNAV